MIFIEVCVGSSCHIKGSPRIVELLQDKIKQNQLEERKSVRIFDFKKSKLQKLL